MKELPTLPPAADERELDSSVHADESAAPQRPILPVDADLEVAVPGIGIPRGHKAPATLPTTANAKVVTPFVIKGSLADGVDPLPAPRAGD